MSIQRKQDFGSDSERKKVILNEFTPTVQLSLYSSLNEMHQHVADTDIIPGITTKGMSTSLEIDITFDHTLI